MYVKKLTEKPEYRMLLRYKAEIHSLTAHGMVKGESAGSEGDSRAFNAASVFSVTCDRHTARGELRSYLVRAPRVQAYFQKGKRLAACT